MLLNVREAANGKWRGILASLGLTDAQLSGKHCPCPVCGGVDRFRFDDKEGRGTFFCSHCGAGSGVDLVMKIKGCGFKEAASEIERAAGFVKAGGYKPAQSDAAKVSALRALWMKSKPAVDGDPVCKYLSGRRLVIPGGLRHAVIPYRDGSEFIGNFDAMLALVQGPDGKGVTIHRTYLKDGKKAPVPSPKKLMPGLPLKGAAIRLFDKDDCLGIAEGIETAIAAHQLFDVPVWSCVSASGIESFEPPEGVKSIIVFADNDESFTGQAAAFALAKRLKVRGMLVEIQMPDKGDWADVVKDAELKRGGFKD
jgi:putative DNA primase/helicase